MNENTLIKILKKRAKGYDSEETVEEYVFNKEEDNLILSKKKITKKNVPPDISAVKLLVEIEARKNSKNQFENMTDEELQNEMQRLIDEITQTNSIQC